MSAGPAPGGRRGRGMAGGSGLGRRLQQAGRAGAMQHERGRWSGDVEQRRRAAVVVLSAILTGGGPS